jgi:anti-sigma regulatory factor (Ser/Thr protein kinase)
VCGAHDGLRSCSRHAAWCDRLAKALAPPPAADDVAILALEVLPLDAERLQVRFPAEPQELSGARRAVGRWLRARHVDDDDVQDLVLALSEACTNAIKHAYGPVPGWVEIEARHDEHLVTVEVRDFGHWRSKRGAGGGLGLSVIEATTGSLEIERRSDGTSVRMQKWLRQEVPA